MKPSRLDLLLALGVVSAGAVLAGPPAAALAAVPARRTSAPATAPQPAPAADSIPAPRDRAYPGTLRLAVDATDVGHRIFRVHEEVPVAPGPLTLLYPEWIPGHHSPTGPIDKLAGLTVSADGRPLVWRRDPGNVYAFHVDVPDGAARLALDFQFLSPQEKEQGRIVMTPEMLDLQWNTVVLYPAGFFSRDIEIEPALTLPAGWQLATALTIAGRDGDRVRFAPIDLENLVDSPVVAGRYFRRVALDAGDDQPVFLDVFADEPRDLEATDDQIAPHRKLVEQMDRLYGARHFDHYDFLLALSDKLSRIGLEHHRSSEDGTRADYFTKWDKRWTARDLLSHEYNHSWDGKYRRPAELWTPNYNVPKRDAGLWVYEGQTQFWGYVMAARSGLWSREQVMESLASVGARYQRGRPGMAWRTIQDTTNDPTIAKRAPLPYRDYQMSEDYYSGGQLVWFAVDAKLRRLTDDRRSLDDFARAFFGGGDGDWGVDTYTFADVVATLDGLAPYDWKAFLTSRLEGHGDLSEGLADEGWRVVYNDQPSVAEEAQGERYHAKSFTYSLGLTVDDEGEVHDVLWNGPAFAAGLSPGMTVVAVDGKEFDPDRLEHAIADAKGGSEPIALLVKDFDEYRTLAVDVHTGLQIPHLERIEGTPDYLSEVLAPRE